MGVYNPIYLKDINIYDVFYNNYQLVIILPMEIHAPIIKIKSINKDEEIFNCIQCPHKHNYVYTLVKDNYIEYIDLIINNIFYKNIKVNKYPEFKNEIIYSTEVKNVDNFIIPWIDYHLFLGITRFIIYNNEY